MSKSSFGDGKGISGIGKGFFTESSRCGIQFLKGLAWQQ